MKVLANQTLFDIALQEFGDARAVFDLAVKNNRNVTEDLTAGQTLNSELSTLNSNLDILTFYKNRNIQPATFINAAELLDGIDYMQIQNDFLIR